MVRHLQQLAQTTNPHLARQRLFRAMHGADQITRRAVILLGRGHELGKVATLLSCHPRLLERRLAAFAERLRLSATPPHPPDASET